jgi:16S rRNA (uracil1498-N3)-methyltransferase
MRRLFGQVDIEKGEVSFSQDALRHIKVIRLRSGENIEILSDGKVYKSLVTSEDPFKVQLSASEEGTDRELPLSSVLLLPLLKRDNFELCLQKATELGVSQIIPFISSRVIKRVSKEEFEEKRERFEKIIKEAVEQSNRSSVPTLAGLTSYQEALQIKGEKRFFAYEDEAIRGKMIPLSPLEKGTRVVSLIGPEGGFSPLEAQEAIKAGFQPISLGKRILRAETAVYDILSLVAYLGEQHE